MGYAVIAAAGLVLIWLLRQLPKLFRRIGSGQQKGKWVYDRSLGGKAVSFAPHTSMAGCISYDAHPFAQAHSRFAMCSLQSIAPIFPIQHASSHPYIEVHRLWAAVVETAVTIHCMNESIWRLSRVDAVLDADLHPG